MRTQPHRIGLIVPSSNTTMEIEVPELLRRQQERGRQRFSFHSTRLRLQQVTPEALQLMNRSGAPSTCSATRRSTRSCMPAWSR